MHGSFKSFISHKDDKKAKKALLHYKVLKEQDNKKSLLEIDLKTGRYHQIRAQLSAIGHPIIGDKKYGRIMSDTSFISKLRETPSDINVSEFEQKILLDFVSIQSYDLLVQNKLAEAILAKILDLQPVISSLQNYTILNCNLSEKNIAEAIKAIYSGFNDINGLWVTGISKIIHVLNNTLFPTLTPI